MKFDHSKLTFYNVEKSPISAIFEGNILMDDLLVKFSKQENKNIKKIRQIVTERREKGFCLNSREKNSQKAEKMRQNIVVLQYLIYFNFDSDFNDHHDPSWSKAKLKSKSNPTEIEIDSKSKLKLNRNRYRIEIEIEIDSPSMFSVSLRL